MNSDEGALSFGSNMLNRDASTRGSRLPFQYTDISSSLVALQLSHLPGDLRHRDCFDYISVILHSLISEIEGNPGPQSAPPPPNPKTALSYTAAAVEKINLSRVEPWFRRYWASSNNLLQSTNIFRLWSAVQNSCGTSDDNPYRLRTTLNFCSPGPEPI